MAERTPPDAAERTSPEDADGAPPLMDAAAPRAGAPAPTDAAPAAGAQADAARTDDAERGAAWTDSARLDEGRDVAWTETARPDQAQATATEAVVPTDRGTADDEAAEPVASRALDLLGQFWAWFFLLGLVVFFSLTGRGFFDLFNFQAIGANLAIMLIMALGQTFVIISGGIDLSTGFVMGLASVGAALAMSRLVPDQPLGVVVLVGLLAGLVAGLPAGLVNGLLVARLKVPPFIGTLGMYGIARGAGFILSGGQPISVQVAGLGQIGNGYLAYYYPDVGFTILSPPPGLQGAQLRQVVGILPHPLTLVILLALASWWLLARSKFGQHTYAIGGNAEAALRAGIGVNRHTVQIYVLSALFAAIAGVLYTARFTNGAANAGDPLLLDSIAAVVIGGASLFGGAGTIVGTVIGALIIAVIQNGLVILAINPFWQFVTVGVVIILAVLVDQARARVIRA